MKRDDPRRKLLHDALDVILDLHNEAKAEPQTIHPITEPQASCPAETLHVPLTEPIMLTPKEAAAFLKISRVTIDEFTKRGLIPVTRFGRIIRYNQADLVNLDTHCREESDKHP